MRASEITEAGELAGVALREVSRGVQRVHGAISRRVRTSVLGVVTQGLPQGRVNRALVSAAGREQGPITRLTYASVAVGLTAGGRIGGYLLARRNADDRSASDSPTAGTVLGFVNGSHGHLLAGRSSPLALTAAVRVGGSQVALTPEQARLTWPEARGEIAIFVHGLVDTERRWSAAAQRAERRLRRAADPAQGEALRAALAGAAGAAQGEAPASEPARVQLPAVDLPNLLEEQLGLTPVLVRYNTGQKIQDSAGELADLVDTLMQVWPVPLTRIVLIGHSMGGLVLRRMLIDRAADQGRGPAATTAWLPMVTDLVTIGSPHGGSWLEDAVIRWSPHLARLPETTWFGEQLALRSDGIRDLGGPSPDAAPRAAIPDGIREHAIVGTLLGDAAGPWSDEVGDLLVSVDSARADLPAEAAVVLPGIHHLGLVHDPRVGRQLVSWLGARRST